MKTVIKLIRKALSKSAAANRVNEMIENSLPQGMDTTSQATEAALNQEIGALKDQLENLKAVVNNFQAEIDTKDIHLATVAREKEKITVDLLKLKRSNTSILKQLEEERKFYFQEKEMYCHEMNEYKELKKSISTSTVANSKSENNTDILKELENTRITLNHTLEANYNLGIKFLRIKNTKTFLKNELKKSQTEYDKIIADLKHKLDVMSNEIRNILDQKFNYPISPSNKKYLELVRHNSSLVYENLCLQLEIDKMNMQFDKMRLRYTKSETNSRLKYIHSYKNETQSSVSHASQTKKEKKKVRIIEKTRERLEKPEKEKKKSKKCPDEVIKLFERKESSGNPIIQVMSEEEESSKKRRKETKVKNESSLSKSNKNIKSCSTVVLSTDTEYKLDVNNVASTAEDVGLCSASDLSQQSNICNVNNSINTTR